MNECQNAESVEGDVIFSQHVKSPAKKKFISYDTSDQYPAHELSSIDVSSLNDKDL